MSLLRSLPSYLCQQPPVLAARPLLGQSDLLLTFSTGDRHGEVDSGGDAAFINNGDCERTFPNIFFDASFSLKYIFHCSFT